MVKYYPTPLDDIFGALSDSTRRQILALLTQGETCVTDIAKSFSISLPAVSKHLRILEKTGLLKRRRDGRTHHLELNAAPMREAAQWIEHYRQFWEGSLDRLATYLEDSPATKPNKRKTKS
ncbi:MAG TPA: metalloregulator ArsR/SmtB family transcription factor [Opitutaceae bacterium]|nr:metalloregulator ArsR/SmtB family transcription factor [Opitutaceae bacterium]